MNELGSPIVDLFDSLKIIKPDSSLTTILNYETFFFADSGEFHKFVENPTRFCCALTDPVSLQRFVPAKTSPFIDHEGRRYYFWSEANKTVFANMPDMYARPHHKMRPVGDSLPTPH